MKLSPWRIGDNGSEEKGAGVDFRIRGQVQEPNATPYRFRRRVRTSRAVRILGASRAPPAPPSGKHVAACSALESQTGLIY